MDLNSILADVQENWWLYCLLPVVAALIGYGTKLAAIHMMFYPLKFVGIKPFGWQGVVPARAHIMAGIACDTLTKDLIRPEELFDRLDPARVAKEIEQPLLKMVDDITREVAAAYQPGLWESMPESVKKMLIKRVQKDAPTMVEDIMSDVRNNLDKVFDLRDMIVKNLTRDIVLLNRMFQETAAEEFKFIRNSGIYFGFAIGCVQAVVWALTHNPWVMPIFGGITGWLTDWLALKLIFEPREEKKVFGLFKWQGMFMKRRDEVAVDYGTIIANEIITPANITDAILTGPMSDRLFEMVQRHVQRAVDEQAGIAKPLMVYRIGSRNYQEMKKIVAERVMERAPEALHEIEEYAADAMDLKTTIIDKVRALSDDDFEGLLRPIFKQDEWKLIAVGAVLGFLVGELQVQIMLSH
tara:strand:+ start:11920 stop:13152 length:1233 start_codon:yes stop_codon:yes gene_type:complete